MAVWTARDKINVIDGDAKVYLQNSLFEVVQTSLPRQKAPKVRIPSFGSL